jgi:hypothetical protein
VPHSGLRRHDSQRNFKEQMDVGGELGSLEGHRWNPEIKAKFAEIFLLARNSNHGPRK